MKNPASGNPLLWARGRQHMLTDTSEKQYKDRLAAWKARKNIKTSEARIMLRKQQERSAQGKRSAFRVGRMEVGMHKIVRAAREVSNYNFWI
jgi:hypothetical protein